MPGIFCKRPQSYSCPSCPQVRCLPFCIKPLDFIYCQPPTFALETSFLATLPPWGRGEGCLFRTVILVYDTRYKTENTVVYNTSAIAAVNLRLLMRVSNTPVFCTLIVPEHQVVYSKVDLDPMFLVFHSEDT